MHSYASMGMNLPRLFGRCDVITHLLILMQKNFDICQIIHMIRACIFIDRSISKDVLMFGHQELKRLY